MGVTVLQPYPLPEGKSGAHIIDHLGKRLLSLGATHAGQFLVDCETFISTPQHGTPTRAVHVLHDSEFPASTFSIIDNGTGKQVALVADAIFDLLMLKMTSTFTSKKQTKIESRGARFEYGDFVIKLGSVTMMEHFKGILIEIEYRPCITLSYCWEMIREMLQGFLGINVAKEYPTYFTTQTIMNAMGQQQLHAKQNDLYEPMDTVKQYLEHFTNYRKHVQLHGGLGSSGLSVNGPVLMPSTVVGVGMGRS
ncbi:mediator of RNA polymerase II transcription subunit 20 [Drosophila grimshawi]|uniref:Mediator of RNA polymerase II transcription subunit 20 n=1 Tax=Drosophila grimshawi TaxID=7222 RepID=B4JL69_DROGR|nr:mediator of RNA polymerase II transcription subunit 20 [Drosophila grimshawi]EDW00322.1 GH12797 [Drosophila grimshawi]